MSNKLGFVIGFLGLLLACDGYALANDTLEDQEAKLIPALHGQVERKGPDLIIHAKNGVVISFNNNTDECSDGVCVKHELVGYLPQFDVLLVENAYNEGADYLWIRLQDGLGATIKGLPHYSPGGTRFAVVEAADMGYSGIQIWDVHQGSPTLELEYDPVKYAQYTFVAWKSENEITLKMMTWVNHKLVDGMPAKLIYSVPKIPGWHLEGPSEASN